MPNPKDPVGVFDSGVGGLAVLSELRRQLPGEDLIYYADSAYFPYGSKSISEIRGRAETITRDLLARRAKAIVVACNTATSAAITHLRATFDVPFIGMEPALKPAAQLTRTGVVALIVTPQTGEGEKLAALIDRHGGDVEVQTIPAPDLAERVESGLIDDAGTAERVGRYLRSLRGSDVDVLALGCTHYAFLRPLMERELGESVTVIEPSAAVARQAAHVLAERGLLNPRRDDGSVLYLTSGEDAAFERVRAKLGIGGSDVREPPTAHAARGRGVRRGLPPEAHGGVASKQ